MRETKVKSDVHKNAVSVHIYFAKVGFKLMFSENFLEFSLIFGNLGPRHELLRTTSSSIFGTTSCSAWGDCAVPEVKIRHPAGKAFTQSIELNLSNHSKNFPLKFFN